MTNAAATGSDTLFGGSGEDVFGGGTNSVPYDNKNDAGVAIIGFDDSGGGQEVIDLSSIFSGPEVDLTLLSNSEPDFDTSGEVGGSPPP